jgi:shikimate dehydrogenase
MPILHKDMQLCISLAARPSNIGTRFHNVLYDELGLDFVYKAFTTTDLPGAVAGIRALGIRGCSVSMPFKEDVIPLVDELEESARAIRSVNTVVNDGGVLTASNTDYEAVASLLDTHAVDRDARVLLRGSGGMAKAVTAAFRGAGFEHLTVVARNEGTGSTLADQYGYTWVDAEDRAGDADLLVNVTPLGMRGDDEDTLSFAPDRVAAAHTVFDVVAFPAETPLVRAGREAGAAVITGAEVIALQAARRAPSPASSRRRRPAQTRASRGARRVSGSGRVPPPPTRGDGRSRGCAPRCPAGR